jgi:plasmid stabilization system protein ParE
MILEFSSEAESDLEQIADYIAQDNRRRALSLSENCGAGVRISSKVRTAWRSSPVKSTMVSAGAFMATS